MNCCFFLPVEKTLMSTTMFNKQTFLRSTKLLVWSPIKLTLVAIFKK